MNSSKHPQPPLPKEGTEQGQAYDPRVLEERDEFTRSGRLKELESADEVDRKEHGRRSVHQESPN